MSAAKTAVPACYDPLVTEALREPSEIAHTIVDALSEHQAEDIVLLDISQISTFADYFVIATAQNARHIDALINLFEKDLANAGIDPLRREGDSASGWVLIDLGPVIAHLFTGDDREFYDLEGLWSRAGVAPVRFQ
jgi:ribosome-associated protein